MTEYCPRGVGFPELLHLTVPYHMNFLQANGVFFSMLPVALMILFFFIFVFTRKFQFIILFSLGCLASGVNQFALKPMKEQSRPPESCLKDTDGFPSGHSVNAMGVWAFITLQELTNYRASWPRKIILCLIYLCTFSFNGPARNIVKDHTWEQIAVGCAAGVVWGTAVWMFFRFIFQRWLLEKLMCTRFARWIRLLNDLDPEFRHSKYKGEKFRGKMNELKNLKHDTTETSALINRKGDDQTPRKKRVIVVHIISVIIQLILGVLAMPIKFYKADMPPESVCPRADIGLVLSIGSFTLATGVALAIVTFLVYRRWCGKTWFPLVLKGSLIFSGTMLMQGALYCYLTFDSVKKQRCPHDDRISRTTGYIIAWGTVEATMIIFWIGLFFIMRLPRLYGNPKLTYPVNGGTMPTAF